MAQSSTDIDLEASILIQRYITDVEWKPAPNNQATKMYNESNRIGAVLVLYGYTKVILIPTSSQDRLCAKIIAIECRYTTYRQSNDFQKRGMTISESQPLPQTITVPEVQETGTPQMDPLDDLIMRLDKRDLLHDF
jgi:hypothetical protein